MHPTPVIQQGANSCLEDHTNYATQRFSHVLQEKIEFWSLPIRILEPCWLCATKKGLPSFCFAADLNVQKFNCDCC